MDLKKFEFWFVTGSQHLYGEEVLAQVAEHSKIMTDWMDAQAALPGRLVNKGVVATPDQITDVMIAASQDSNCAGVITWMHTFSPSKMWINGLSRLTKPLLHINTQFNRDIPWDDIDMDFMNLNQSAHGDREHGFIGARLRIPRKIVVGFWQDEAVLSKIGGWMRSAIGVQAGFSLKCARFGDNMREVAVTEGDKVEAQKVFGWSVNYYPVGDLVPVIDAITESEIDEQMAIYNERYDIRADDLAPVRYQAKMEAGLKKFLVEKGFTAFTSTFEDLHGLDQLEGLAAQDMMLDGMGYGAEGDWKGSCMSRIMKLMATGLEGGTSFMEDYTYHMEPGREMVLGAHMLEVCPSIAADKPTIEVHPLGIGNRKPPARLVFDGAKGSAILVSLIDMGGRMRMIVNDCEAEAPLQNMPKLPVARVMWKPAPDLQRSAEAWILCGGAHHSVMSYALTAENMRDFAEMAGIEFVHINKDTDINQLREQLRWNDLAYKLGM